MSKYRIREILDEIDRLERDINAGYKVWNGDEEGDPCTMADCDPSDQYCKEGGDRRSCQRIKRDCC